MLAPFEGGGVVEEGGGVAEGDGAAMTSVNLRFSFVPTVPICQ